jgi:hypothetical protein
MFIVTFKKALPLCLPLNEYLSVQNFSPDLSSICLTFVPCIIRRSKNNQHSYVHKHMQFGFYPHVYSATVLPYAIAFPISLFYHLGHIFMLYIFTIFYLIVHPVVIMSFNLFCYTQGVLHTNYFIRYIF